jgi:hypothetical protein
MFNRNSSVMTPARTGFLALILGGAALLASACSGEDAAGPKVDTEAAACQLNCRDLKNCRALCKDDACRQICDARSTPEAKMAYDAAFACIQANGCTDDDCAEQKCGNVVAACIGPRGAPVPPATCPLTCSHLENCRLQCADAACKQTCYANALPAAQLAYDAKQACIAAHSCKDDECAVKSCAAETDACRF